MMPPTHTPGPWKLKQESADPHWHIVTNDNGHVVVANVHIDPANPSEVATVPLILAAPDLLEALRYIVAWGPTGWDVEKARDMANAAIAKAEGR